MKATLKLGNKVVTKATEVVIFEELREGFEGQLKWEAKGGPKRGEYLLVLEDGRKLRVDFYREGVTWFDTDEDEPLKKDWLYFRLLEVPEPKK